MPGAPALHILLLAAGASSRMRGRDKLLERIDATPQLTRIATAAQATGCPVWVALAPDKPARTAALDGLALRLITVPNPGLGLSASLAAGLQIIPPQASVMMLLADLPEIEAADLITVASHQAKYPGDILRATATDGRFGHPVVFPPWARAHLGALQGDTGAREFLARHTDRTRPVPLPAAHATTDLDTPEDWAEWRGRTGR